MTAVRGKIVIAIVTRCLQVLQLAMHIVSAVLQSALVTVKSTCQVLLPQTAKSLAGEVVLVCTVFLITVASAGLETARATSQSRAVCAKKKFVLVTAHTYTLLISVPVYSDKYTGIRLHSQKLRFTQFG
jgi:archaellum biogenesis ATPase FlaH